MDDNQPVYTGHRLNINRLEKQLSPDYIPLCQCFNFFDDVWHNYCGKQRKKKKRL